MNKGLLHCRKNNEKLLEPATPRLYGRRKVRKGHASIQFRCGKIPVGAARRASQYSRSKGGTPYGMKEGTRTSCQEAPRELTGYQKVLDAEVRATEKDAEDKRKIELAKQRAALAKEIRGQTSRQMENHSGTTTQRGKYSLRLNPSTDVANRAQEYVQAPSGPGECELMLAYVEATKPQTGFAVLRKMMEFLLINRVDGIEGARHDRGSEYEPSTEAR